MATPGPVHGAWARMSGSSSSPGLVLAHQPHAQPAHQPAAHHAHPPPPPQQQLLPMRGVSPSRAALQAAGLQDSLLYVMEGMGELQEQVRELAPLRELPARVAELEARARAAEAREEALRAELARATDALGVLTSLVSRISREDGLAQGALARLAEEAARLKSAGEHAKGTKGHGTVRNFSPRS